MATPNLEFVVSVAGNAWSDFESKPIRNPVKDVTHTNHGRSSHWDTGQLYDDLFIISAAVCGSLDGLFAGDESAAS